MVRVTLNPRLGLTLHPHPAGERGLTRGQGRRARARFDPAPHPAGERGVRGEGFGLGLTLSPTPQESEGRVKGLP